MKSQQHQPEMMNRSCEQKLFILESAIHSLQCAIQVTMRHDWAEEIVRLMCEWSYAHRSGELTDEEREQRIEEAYERLVRSLP